MKHKTAGRNREIFTAHALGQTTGELADRYGLTVKSVRQILAMERHKRAVSKDAFYEGLRGIYR
jgi:Mor family transcriptional regulator